MPIFAAMRIERHWRCVLFRVSVFFFGFIWYCCKEIAARIPYQRGAGLRASRAPSRWLFFSANFAFKEDSRLLRDCGASGYEGGGFVPKSLPDVVGGCG